MSLDVQKLENSNDNWQPHRCDNPWKPNMHNGQSEVYRRMLGILNRVTQQSIPILLEQALELPITDAEHLPSILNLLLSKSQDEPLFASTYADFCYKLAQRIDIQEPLTLSCDAHFSESLQRLLEYERLFEDCITVELIHQEILARKRLSVHMGFVCELEKKGIVPFHQLINMTQTLLSNGDLRSMECLCSLLSYCGAKISNSRQDLVDQCCASLQNLLNGDTLSPRLKFLMQDTIDLRANGWRPRGRQNGPFTGRNVRGKEVMKRWGNIRDSFQKSEKKYKSSLKSGSGTSTAKTYIFGPQLQFLKKVIQERPTVDSLSGDNEYCEEDGTGQITGIAEKETSGEGEITFKRPSSRKRKADPVELQLIEAIKEKPDRHMSFFRGIIPSLNNFDDDEIVEFQISVLQIVSAIKRRKTSAHNNNSQQGTSFTSHFDPNMTPQLLTKEATLSPYIPPQSQYPLHSSRELQTQSYHTLHPVRFSANQQRTLSRQYYESIGQEYSASPSPSDNSENSYDYDFADSA